LIIGHRGLPLGHPDNSLAGILAAGALCDMVEVDVRWTADWRPVLAHDPEVGGLVVAEQPWEVLSAVDLGDGQHPAALDEVLAVTPVPLDLEIKHDPHEPGFDPSYELPLAVAGLAREGDVVTSFHWPTMAAVRGTWPDVTTGLLVGEHHNLLAAIEDAVSWDHSLVAAHWSLLSDDTAARVLEAHESGIDLFAWTVDDCALARMLVTAGVRGIVTNDPITMRRELEDLL
jgi:glycerophosphoryl diester phosphodiesterase